MATTICAMYVFTFGGIVRVSPLIQCLEPISDRLFRLVGRPLQPTKPRLLLLRQALLKAYPLYGHAQGLLQLLAHRPRPRPV